MSYTISKTNYRIDKDHEVRTQTGMIRISNVFFSEMSSGCSSKMAPCRKAHNAYFVFLNAPLPGIFTHYLYRALRILDGAYLFIDHGLIVRYTVFENECRYAQFCKFAGHICAFMS